MAHAESLSGLSGLSGVPPGQSGAKVPCDRCAMVIDERFAKEFTQRRDGRDDSQRLFPGNFLPQPNELFFAVGFEPARSS
ncbi:MAG: hypothetical protein KDC54_02900 [Lewinella sp.]|nr:hypothetical protein [Lewinella sp.]